MITAMREIGELVSESTLGIKRQIEGKVLAVLLNLENQSYEGVEIEDFDPEKIGKYLYKERASKGNSPAPFCPLTEAAKTYSKIEVWFKNCVKLHKGLSSSDLSFVNKAAILAVSKKDEIVESIKDKMEDLRKVRAFLTVKLNRKYLGEYEVLRDCFTKSEELRRKKSSSLGLCSICSQLSQEVSGTANVFKFYTIDKPGFISGGFRKDLAWKNYPVCSDCFRAIENGRKFIENNLNYRFYGLSYLLIPRLLFGSKDLLKDILHLLSDSVKRISLKERIKKRITNDENEILEYLSEQKDFLTLNFLFLQKQQSAERILLLIEDVLPSRIRKIFEAKDHVEALFGEEFNLGKIRTFFFKSDENKRESDLDKYFLEIVACLFRGRKINFSFLAKFYMAVLRREFINERYFSFRTKDALMVSLFLEYLGLINFMEETAMEESLWDSFFKKYGKSFTHPAKRGIFLLGALTQLLLNKQYQDRQAKPFMKKLKSLKMDERDIKGLLPEVQSKLEEYDSFDKGKRLIASEISENFLMAGDGWKMTVDEINYYFACGMNLADAVAEMIYKKDI